MKTASRLNLVKASATLALTTRARQMKRAGRDVINFGVGEPDFDTPVHIIDAAKRALDQGQTRYSAVAGIPELRDAIAVRYQRRYGIRTSAENVMVSVGGKHVLYNLAMALIDDGDRVLIPSPYWLSYPAQVLLAGGVPVFLETTQEQNFKVTPHALDAALTEHKPVYLILNSPANPTGMAYGREELLALFEVLRKHPDVLIVWDSIYERLVYDGFCHVEPGQLAPDLVERTVITTGFSKTYAMTGWRLGYAIASPEIIEALTIVQGHSTSNATTFAQVGALAALSLSEETTEDMVAVFDTRRLRMVELLNQIDGVECLKPVGAFYVFPDVTAFIGRSTPDGTVISNDVDLAEYLLEEAGTAVLPGSVFGGPGHLRLSFALANDDIERGVPRMAQALAKIR